MMVFSAVPNNGVPIRSKYNLNIHTKIHNSNRCLETIIDLVHYLAM